MVETAGGFATSCHNKAMAKRFLVATAFCIPVGGHRTNMVEKSMQRH